MESYMVTFKLEDLMLICVACSLMAIAVNGLFGVLVRVWINLFKSMRDFVNLLYEDRILKRKKDD